MAVIYPLVEEILFRGVIQPNIAEKISGSFFNLSLANIITSTIFAIAHLINHDPLWAAGTILPSLAFGFCQDRYRTLQAPIALHCYYNAGYFLIAGI
jgi:membrane protease YdiL (CAAX protease family)